MLFVPFRVASHVSFGFVAIVRIRSTTWDRLLHGLVLLPSGISGKMTITLDIFTTFAC